jgi:cell division protein FtsN
VQITENVDRSDFFMKQEDKVKAAIATSEFSVASKLALGAKSFAEVNVPVLEGSVGQPIERIKTDVSRVLGEEKQQALAKVIVKSADKKLQPPSYFAQLAAFKSESSAKGWRRSRLNLLPSTSLVEKKSGLWAVVSGPFKSKEAAVRAFSEGKMKVYVVKGSDLKFGFIGASKT